MGGAADAKAGRNTSRKDDGAAQVHANHREEGALRLDISSI